MKNYFKLLNDIIFKEGIYNYILRKRNISYLDSVTIRKIHFHGKDIKIILNRKFGYVDMMIFKNGIYEREIVEDIYNEVYPDKVFLDIGSNIGQHSLLMAAFCKKVYSFEPIKEVFNQFQKSVKLNHFHNVEAFNKAVGDKKESLIFNYVSGHAGTSSFIERDDENVKKIKVEVDTLQNVLGDNKIDVIKIDVEGFEAVVLMGNQDFILKNNPVIFLEFSKHWIERQKEYSADMVYDFFENNGFNIYSRKLGKTISKEDLKYLGQDNWIVRPSKFEQ